MKKKKFLLAAVATATVMTCALGLTACNSNNNAGDGGHGDGQIAAVYQLYASNAQASGEAVLTYEQWLASIKGATGATGASGKSAYEIAKENGFTGTEAEWLESLKGNDGDAGKSAYEIAKENGFTGTEAEWLESLKGNDGDRGVGVEGVYQTSDGLYIKFTDGTAQPVQNGGVEHQLLVVGENEIAVGSQVNTDFKEAPVTIVSFFTLTKGTYKFTLYDTNISLYEGTVSGSNTPFLDFEVGAGCLNGSSFGTNSDGSFYNSLTFDKDYQFFVTNWSGSATTVRLTIEKIS